MNVDSGGWWMWNPGHNQMVSYVILRLPVLVFVQKVPTLGAELRIGENTPEMKPAVAG